MSDSYVTMKSKALLEILDETREQVSQERDRIRHAAMEEVFGRFPDGQAPPISDVLFIVNKEAGEQSPDRAFQNVLDTCDKLQALCECGPFVSVSGTDLQMIKRTLKLESHV